MATSTHTHRSFPFFKREPNKVEVEKVTLPATPAAFAKYETPSTSAPWAEEPWHAAPFQPRSLIPTLMPEQALVALDTRSAIAPMPAFGEKNLNGTAFLIQKAEPAVSRIVTLHEEMPSEKAQPSAALNARRAQVEDAKYGEKNHNGAFAGGAITYEAHR